MAVTRVTLLLRAESAQICTTPSSPTVGPSLGMKPVACHAEHAKCEHLLRRDVGPGLLVEIAASRRRQHVAIALLHPVVDDDDACHRGSLSVQHKRPSSP